MAPGNTAGNQLSRLLGMSKKALPLPSPNDEGRETNETEERKMTETELETLQRERNLYKGKNASLLALLSKMRDRLGVITTEIEDEGDRAYFGSTNDADELKEFESDMIDWLIDAEVPHLTMTEDPYASIREQRERADKAETELSLLRSENEAMRKALEDLVECHDAFTASMGNMEEAYYKLAKYAYPQWQAARAALSKEPQS